MTAHQSQQEALPSNMEANVAVLTVEMRHARESLERIENQMGAVVTRNEWEQRNGYVDGRFAQSATDITGVRGEVAQLRRDVDAKRAPWWSVSAVVIAAAALLVTIIPVLSR